MGSIERCPLELSLFKDGTAQVGTLEGHIAETGADEVRSTQIGTYKADARQNGIFEDRDTQLGTVEDHVRQFCTP